MKTMKAAVLFEINKPLQIVDIPIQPPSKGQVLVKLAASGICHTQLLEIKGENAIGPKFIPNMLGHEGTGIVEEVGEDVKKVKKGDHVILSWIKGKGANVVPKLYDFQGKKINAGYVTTFNEYTLASENRVTPIPKDFPLLETCLLGCAVPTGMGAVFNNAKVKEKESVMVYGVGGVGINMVHAASIAKADPIIAVDIYDHKLQSAKIFGATHTISARTENIEQRIREILGEQTEDNKGLDYAFDTVGKKQTMEFIYNSVKKASGKAIMCGVPNPPKIKIEIDPFPLYYGRKLTATHGGETNPDVDYPKYCNMYLEGKLKLKEMVSHVVSLEEINKGIDYMKSGECLRVVIDFNKK